MTGERTNRYGWPYNHPINVDFDVNWDSPQSRGLVAWWPFIGGQGGWPVPDRAFQRYPMAPFNTPTWISDGEKGWAVLFDDAANEYLSVSASPVIAPFTLSCWFNSDDLINNQVLVGIGGAAANYTELVASGAGGGDPIDIRSAAGGGPGAAVTTTGYSANTWHHACGVEFGASRAAYIDGGSKGTDANVRAPALTTTFIGRHAVGGGIWFMSGKIMDVRIYNRALSDTEVYNLYANPWELYGPRIPELHAFVAAAGQPMMLRGTTVPHIARQWQPRGLRG